MKFFLLDKQQNIIGRLSEEYILEATFTEEINTAGELLITLPAKKRLSGNVIHVLITNPSKDHSYLMFKIIKETVKDEEVEYTAVESAYDELTSYGYIQDKRPTANAQTIAEMILKDTRWHVGEIPDTSEAFISFYYLSVLDCLKKIVQTFDFEIGFDVLINDDENQITDRRVNFYIKQGEQTGKRFEYGSNLLSIKQEQDTQNIYTALVGRGKGVQVSGGDDDNTPGGYGRRITFADVEWSKANGDPLDKPKGQEWLEDPDATKQLGFSDGHMRIGLEVFEDVDDPKTLLQKTYEALKTAERPQVQFSASVINTGELHLGDRVGITRNDIGIAYETRVFKVQHNLLDETQNKIDLGDNLEQTNNLSYQVSALQSEVTNNTEGIITVTQSANGKNKVYYSSTMPATGSNGDVWYKDLGNGETEMYIYDNGWQLVVSTEQLDTIQKTVDEQTVQISQAEQNAQDAVNKADSLISQVGTATSNAQQALTMAQQGQADITAAKNQITANQQGLQGVQADLSAVKQQAIDQGKTIVSLQQSDISLTSQIADAQGDITGLKQTASSLQSSVQDNANNISNVKQTATQLSSTISNLQNAGENLIINSTFSQDSYHWNMNGYQISQDVLFMNLKGVSITQTGLTSPNYKSISATDKIPVSQGQSISFGCWIKTSGVDDSGAGNRGAQIGVNWYADKNSGRNHWNDTYVITGNHDWVYIKLENIKVPTDSNFVTFNMFLTQNGTAQFVLPLMVFGSTLPSWSPSPLDSATATDMSSVKQTVSSLQSTVQSNTGDISTLKQTANSLQNSIQSKADISQVTQLSNTIQSTVQTIGPMLLDGDFSDKDLSKYWEPWDTTTNMNATWVGGDGSMKLSGINNDNVKYIYKYYMPINGNLSVTYKGKSKLTYSGSLVSAATFYFHFYDENKKELSPVYGDYYKYDKQDVWQDFSSTVTPPAGAAYVRIESYLNCNGTTTKVWLSVDNLQVINGAGTVSSKISQLSDDINLRVQKGDLLSQINIEAGQTLIQSDKLYLDASSVVFSGNAFIPSAAITDLSADKITTGTLNAANVNIINLNVDKLVGDTTSFVSSAWNTAYGSNVNIDGGGMSITYGDWLTKFEPDGMVFRDGNEDIGGFTRVGMQNAPSWYGGLAFNAGGDAEFLAIGAKDYHNDSQNPVPAKLLWMRQGINTYGYHSGWNFCDDVWAGQVGMSSIQYDDWNIHFEKITGNDGFSALTLVSGSGDGFYWGSDGSFGYVTNHGGLHNVRGSQIVYDINQNGGTCQSWSGVD